MKKINTRKSLMTILLLLALGIGALTYFFVYDRKSSSSPPAISDTTEEAEINLEPPTEEDVAEAERHKEQLAKETDSRETTPRIGQQPVTPVIGFVSQASSGNVEANGYVSETVESGGKCTLILERNGIKFTTTKEAMPDAQSTICGLMTIERAKLEAGDWKVYINYESAGYKGTSKERIVKVN